MKSNEEHTKFASLFGVTKKKAWEVNNLMDYMSRYLGSSHRVIGHGLKFYNIPIKDKAIKIQKFQPDIMELLLITGFDPEKLMAFYLHAIADDIITPKITVSHKTFYRKRK